LAWYSPDSAWSMWVACSTDRSSTSTPIDDHEACTSWASSASPGPGGQS
jgi:hypothetical protein